jgi:hypothetical protein
LKYSKDAVLDELVFIEATPAHMPSTLFALAIVLKFVTVLYTVHVPFSLVLYSKMIVSPKVFPMIFALSHIGNV